MDKKIIIVKPKPGKRVLDPATVPPSPLPEEGRRVVEEPYWLRRAMAGEVEILPVTPPAEGEPANRKQKEAKE